MAAALSRVYAGLCRRDRLTSKECPFWLYLFCDVDVNKHIAFIGHGRTRHSQIPLVMKAPHCKTNAFQASFYNRIVKFWNTICKSAPVHGFSNISSFKQLLKQTYLTLFNASFDIDFPCTWTLSRDSSCH
jgi:hypothetical protein